MTNHRVFLALFVIACGTTPDAPVASPEAAPPPMREAPPAVPPPAAQTKLKLGLSGTILFEGTVKGGVVFISVKDPARPGPPLAAAKYRPGPFPLEFTLTDADIVQMGETAREMPAEVALSVWLDEDGDALTKAATDPKALVETAPVAAEPLTLTLTLAPS